MPHFHMINTCRVIIHPSAQLLPSQIRASQICPFAYFFTSCLHCKDSKSPKNTSFFFQENSPIQLTYCLENISGGHLRKPSQSRADLEVQYQKISPKPLFSTANSHKEIGDGGRSREGVCSGGHGLPGQKAKHAVWWWWGDSSTPGSNLSAVKISMLWLKCFFSSWPSVC